MNTKPKKKMSYLEEAISCGYLIAYDLLIVIHLILFNAVNYSLLH